MRQALLPFDRGSDRSSDLPKVTQLCSLPQIWETHGQLLCLDTGLSGWRPKPCKLGAGEDREFFVTGAQGWSLAVMLSGCQAPGLLFLAWSLAGSVSQFPQLLEMLGLPLCGAPCGHSSLPVTDKRPSSSSHSAVPEFTQFQGKRGAQSWCPRSAARQLWNKIGQLGCAACG